MNKKRIQYLLLRCILFSLLFWCYPFAQGKDIRFRHITIDDGLSQNSAKHIVQDRHGFIWIGTETGLNKYNGYTFTVYDFDPDNPNSLSNEYILYICIDRSGIFWVGTENGLNRFDPVTEQFTRYLHNPDDPNSLSNNRVVAILEDNSGELWIGTENGLNKLNRESKHFVRYMHIPGNQTSVSHTAIRSLFQDNSGVLWIGTDGGGLNKFDRKTDQFTSFTHSPDNPHSLSNNSILCLFEDKTSTFWIGTDGGGLNIFNREKEQFVCYKNIPGDPASLSGNHVNVVYEDTHGDLWIGTNNEGLNIFDRESNVFVHYKNIPDNPYSLSVNRVYSIFEDYHGGLWFGTAGGGMNVFNRESQKFIHYKHDPDNPNSLSDNCVWDMYEDKDGILWLATDFGGLNAFNRKTGRFTHFKNNPDNPNSLNDNSVYTVCEDRAGVHWIGTRAGGLNKFDKKTGRFTHYKHNPKDQNSISSNKVFCIYEDHSDILWLGTNGGGLNKFDRETGKATRYTFNPDNPHSISSNKIYCILEDDSNNLWITAYGGGLNKYDRENDQFIRFQADTTNKNSLNNNFILSLFVDHAGIFWVGTINGLTKFDRANNTFSHYTKKNGLPDNVIYDIIEDNSKNLWMSTNRGLSQFNPRTGEFKNYDVKDGLQSNEFNTHTAYKNKSGEIYFGGINGFNVFYPDSIKNNPQVPKIVITDFQIFNKSVPIGKMADGRSILERSIPETEEITLTFRDNVFSFEFAALHYAAPEENQYAYLMEGLEKEWNYVSSNRRYATYTRLSPGSYIFRVKGSNNDGVWNEEGTSLRITIVPPYWRTWWFYFICAVGFIAFAALIYRYRVTQLKREKEEEERRRIFVNLNLVLEQGSAAVYRRNVDSNVYEYMGEGIRDITGYRADEITVALWRKIIIRIEMSDDLKGLSMEDLFERVQKGKLDRWVSEYQIRTKAGDIRWLRDMVSTLRDASGRCYAYLGIMFDITDRKLSEQKLAQTFIDEKRKSKSIQSTFFEHTADPILIFDKETHLFLDCNKAFMKNYGYSRAEIRTMTPFDLHPPEDTEKVEKNIDVRNVDIPHEYKHITKDGRTIDVEILSDETMYKGKPAWISMVRNITERKQVELKLKQLSEELQSQNQEMEKDLNMAREVQSSILSKSLTCFPLNSSEDTCTLRFNHHYQPASTLAGDFFDILPISDHEVGIIICDVMGHGARASLLTFYLRGLIEQLMPLARDPSEFMKNLNTGLHSIMERFYTGFFATAFYCIADINTGQLRYTNAGHPFPLLLHRSNKTAEKLLGNGNKPEPAIGIHEEFNFSVNTRNLTKDDIVFFFTDGLYEVEGNDGMMYGYSNFVTLVQRICSISPTNLIPKILASMSEFTLKKEFEDDVCMVTMQVRKLV